MIKERSENINEEALGTDGFDAQGAEYSDSELTDDTQSDEVPDGEGGGEADGECDYATLEREDLAALALIFPEVKGKRSITELKDPIRYAALRDLGLTPKEAYLATEGVRRTADNRRHIVSRVPASAGSANTLSGKELSAARELFSGLSDREIQRLYKKVTV